MSFRSHSGTTPFKKYAERATGGESQAVCKLTATKIANQVRLNPSASIKGSIIGTIIITIGTHSNGKPNKKSVSSIGVPNLENTAPKKFEAATKTIISAEISKVLTSESCNFLKVSFL